ncbi:MAG: hypothetical protein JO061_03680 [Acidobacteriaceae bacterium]|nr:hypothetical protein [Acidobacteriaceae bacterium]
MRRTILARLLMTVVLLGGAISSFFLDWRTNHLLNPAWPPHARFHGALLLFFLAGVSATCIWLLWRRSAEPSVAFQVAALVSASFWTPFFYVTTLLPEANLWAGPAGARPRIAGVQFYPNVITAAFCLILTGVSYWLSPEKTAAER